MRDPPPQLVVRSLTGPSLAPPQVARSLTGPSWASPPQVVRSLTGPWPLPRGSGPSLAGTSVRDLTTRGGGACEGPVRDLARGARGT